MRIRIGDSYKAYFCELVIVDIKKINDIEHIFYSGRYLTHGREAFENAHCTTKCFEEIIKENNYTFVEDEEML
jgi:TATA-box binding protein (TBP) (component of TFIID and TFIIIB)